MSKTLAPSIVTLRDRKGRKFLSIVEAAYNKANLQQDEAQLVNDASGLSDLVDWFIERHRYLRVGRVQLRLANSERSPKYLLGAGILA